MQLEEMIILVTNCTQRGWCNLLKCVIFDLCWTLLDFGSTVDWANARKNVARVYVENGIPVKNVLEHPDVFTLFYKMFDVGKKYLPKKSLLEIQEEVDEIIDNHEAKATNDVKILKGSLEVLNWMKNTERKTGVVTNNGIKTVSSIIEKTGIRNLIDVVRCRNLPGRPKPHPDHVVDCLENLGCGASETIMVGDHPDDMKAANAAKVYSIHVPFHRKNNFTLEELQEAGMQRQIQDLTMLPTVIQELEVL